MTNLETIDSPPNYIVFTDVFKSVQESRSILKIERYRQSLTHRVSTKDKSSSKWAPV